MFRHGDLVVDAVAGLADRVTGRPATPHTPFFSFSTGKGLASTVAHVLVRDGAVGYETPVVELWPEFGAHGKAATTLRHVLTHTAGVPAMPGGLAPDASWTGRGCARPSPRPSRAGSPGRRRAKQPVTATGDSNPPGQIKSSTP